MPKEAPLTTVERWEQAFTQADANDWPDGIDRSNIILGVLRMLAIGLGSAKKGAQHWLLPQAWRWLTDSRDDATEEWFDELEDPFRLYRGAQETIAISPVARASGGAAKTEDAFVIPI